MEDQKKKGSNRKLYILLGLAGLILAGMWLYPTFTRVPENAMPTEPLPVTELGADEVVDSIHVATGLKVAQGFEIVRSQCTACHSGKLVAQNRATREGWQTMIRWMQETQGLWPLGAHEPVILDYLATNYGPQESGRRPNLEEVEWYVLEME